MLEIKAVRQIHPLHEARLLMYLRISGLQRGLLLNFNSIRLTDGIRRIASMIDANNERPGQPVG